MRITTGRLLAAAVSTLSLGLLVAPGAAHAADPSPAAPAGHIGGVVPPHGQARSGSVSTAGNLSYHGGPVMHSSTVYAVYWVPSGYNVSSGYETIINGYFANLTSAGPNGNVYAVDTQYSDSGGAALGSGGLPSETYTVVNDKLPRSGCRDRYTSVCLTDSQIQSELQKVIAAKGWPIGPSNLFVMLTARGIGSCSGSSCAFSQYCAYHGSVGSGSSEFVYANMPYADTVSTACDTGQYPNNDQAADSEINILSHEQNEAITDEALNAWYDSQGSEIGDKCAWNFGTAHGTSGHEYNQTINGQSYYVQQEWSNSISGCSLGS